MSDHRDNTPDKDTLPDAPDWYTARLQQLTERTRQLEQEKELKARANGWQLIDTLTENDDLILAYRDIDGAQMIWRASILLRNLRGPTPFHLGFRATHWRQLPAPPNKPENNDWQAERDRQLEQVTLKVRVKPPTPEQAPMTRLQLRSLADSLQYALKSDDITVYRAAMRIAISLLRQHTG